MEEQIKFECRDRVGILQLNTPPLNLQTLESMRQLGSYIELIGKNPEIQALVVTGEGGRVFCAGSDVKEFNKLRGNFIEEKLRYENYVFNSLAELPILTFAAITGSALGGGLELALCCDFRIMADDAILSMPEINLGNFPGSGGPSRLTRCVGPYFAAEMMSIARSLNAQEALSHGLVNEILPRELVTQRTITLAKQVSDKPKRMLAAIKALVYASLHESTSQASDHELKCFVAICSKY